ncbi:MAG: hypothetical protein II793_00300 [Bacteroidales bacterium]|nr:hypothetical protein [Bacteroidales bacterium]
MKNKNPFSVLIFVMVSDILLDLFVSVSLYLIGNYMVIWGINHTFHTSIPHIHYIAYLGVVWVLSSLYLFFFVIHRMARFYFFPDDVYTLDKSYDNNDTESDSVIDNDTEYDSIFDNDADDDTDAENK